MTKDLQNEISKRKKNIKKLEKEANKIQKQLYAEQLAILKANRTLKAKKTGCGCGCDAW